MKKFTTIKEIKKNQVDEIIVKSYKNIMCRPSYSEIELYIKTELKKLQGRSARVMGRLSR
jgi:hypothetical protein